MTSNIDRIMIGRSDADLAQLIAFLAPRVAAADASAAPLAHKIELATSVLRSTWRAELTGREWVAQVGDWLGITGLVNTVLGAE